MKTGKFGCGAPSFAEVVVMKMLTVGVGTMVFFWVLIC